MHVAPRGRVYGAGDAEHGEQRLADGEPIAHHAHRAAALLLDVPRYGDGALGAAGTGVQIEVEAVLAIPVRHHRLQVHCVCPGAVFQPHLATRPHFVAEAQQPGHVQRAAAGAAQSPAVWGLHHRQVAVGHRQPAGDQLQSSYALEQVQLEIDALYLPGRQRQLANEKAGVETLPPAFQASHRSPLRQQPIDHRFQARQLPGDGAAAQLEQGEGRRERRHRDGDGECRRPERWAAQLHGLPPTGSHHRPRATAS